jgi:HK97 family phage major capsid protein
VTAGTTAVWGSINTATGDTKVTLGQITLTAYPLVGISYVPNELIQDSMLSIGGLLADEFTDSFARKIDACAFIGDATSSTAYKADGWSDAATTNRAGSGTSGDSANGSLAYDHIMEMVGKLSSTALNGAIMVMAPTTFAQVRTISDAGSNLLVNIDKDYRYNILGFPTYLSDNMTAKASVAAGDALILFGNPRNYIIGDRMDLSIQSSEHIAFTANQTVFRAIQRIAMSVGIETELAVLARMAAGGTYGPAAS